MKESLIQRKSFVFALEIIRIYKKLVEEREYVLSKQLLRSGTSIGANIAEATAAQSQKDFLSKMAIASKEARETQYWIQLLMASELTKIDLRETLDHANELGRILTSIVKTTQSQLKTKN